MNDDTQQQTDATEIVTAQAPSPTDTVGQLTLERDEYLNGWKRALADLENYKKEQAKRSSDMQIYQLASLIRELLPLIDTLTLALQHIPAEQKEQPWYQGLQAIYAQWKQFLATNGITSMESKGTAFDPEFHEAIGTESDASVKDNTVLSVASEGYILNNHLVLRPAKVIVNQL